MTFGAYLRSLRESRGFYRQHELAKASGVSSGTISRIEAGVQVPQADTLRLLAQTLCVSYIGMLIKAGHVTEDEVLTFRQQRGVIDQTVSTNVCIIGD